MDKLIITNKEGYVYKLIDEKNSEYSINLEFLEMEQPKVEDVIYINKELLNPKYDGYSTSYTFGNLNSEYGKKDIAMDDIDVIKYVCNDKEIFLKRLYG